MKQYSFLQENKKGALASMLLAPLGLFAHTPTNTVTNVTNKVVKTPQITQVVKKGSKALANIAERRLKTGQATDIVKTVEEFISSHPNLKSYEVNMLRHNAFLDKTDYVAFLMKQFSK